MSFICINGLLFTQDEVFMVIQFYYYINLHTWVVIRNFILSDNKMIGSKIGLLKFLLKELKLLHTQKLYIYIETLTSHNKHNQQALFFLLQLNFFTKNIIYLINVDYWPHKSIKPLSLFFKTKSITISSLSCSSS